MRPLSPHIHVKPVRVPPPVVEEIHRPFPLAAAGDHSNQSFHLVQVSIRREWSGASDETCYRFSEWRHRKEPFAVYAFSREQQMTSLLMDVAHELVRRPVIYRVPSGETSLITQIYKKRDEVSREITLLVPAEILQPDSKPEVIGKFLYDKYRPVLRLLLS